MNSKKIFFLSFAIAFAFMLSSFMALYWVLDIKPEAPVDAKKNNVPILSAGPEDSKTVLLCINDKQNSFFFLTKFNALQNKVTFISIPSETYLSVCARTLQQSLDYAGMMQCVYDLNQQFSINIDYHLLSDYENIGEILSSFSGFDASQIIADLPTAVKKMLIAGNEYIDSSTIINILQFSGQALNNPAGLEFLNLAGFTLLKSNLVNLKAYGIADIKNNFSYLTTNFNVESLNIMQRILSFLHEGEAAFERMVLSADAQNADEMLKLLNE